MKTFGASAVARLFSDLTAHLVSRRHPAPAAVQSSCFVMPSVSPLRLFLLYCLVAYLGATTVWCDDNVSASDAPEYQGIPFLRAYPYEEIGYAARSARLAFDPFGRVALVREGAFDILNDNVWIDSSRDRGSSMVRVLMGNDGQMYYGSRGLWGRVEMKENGRWAPVEELPDLPPLWTKTAYFDDLHAGKEQMFFGSWNGTVVLSYATGLSEFVELKDQSCLVPVGDSLYVASRSGIMSRIERVNGSYSLVPVVRGAPVLKLATAVDSHHALVVGLEDDLFVFDGERFERWKGDATVFRGGQISSLRRLANGDVAVAVLGNGLFVFTHDGRLRHSFTTPRFRQISDIGSREEGVIWLTSEDSVIKLLYNCPIENFGNDLGLFPRWPLVVEFKGRTLVGSDGVLYEIDGARVGKTAAIVMTPHQPVGGVWAMASNGTELLVGNPSAIYEWSDEGPREVMRLPGLNSLSMMGNDVCLASGPNGIAALLRDSNGRWYDSGARAEGLGYSPIVHASRVGMWVELASQGVARVSYNGKARRIDVEHFNFWPEVRWTSVSVVKDYVMMTGRAADRIFYDMNSGTWTSFPRIEKALDASREWIIRVGQGHDGTLWGMTDKGVIAFYEQGDGYVVDAKSFDFIGDLYPAVSVMPSGKVWITANQALYRADPDYRPKREPAAPPVIVSVQEIQSGKELWAGRNAPGVIRLDSEGKGVSIRLFAGTYNNRKPPAYEYRIGSNDWTEIDTGSVLSLRELKAGDYPVEIRARENHETEAPTATLTLQVPEPWYRTTPARIVEAILLVVLFGLLLRLSNRVARRRSEALERMVSDRTRELESAMERLNEETRVAATLVERNRLASEIHDSLQQGLSGAILQLDSTMCLPEVNSRLQTRLNIVRNMISFTRHEVQNAVWDKESPLLGDSELGEALERLTAFISTEENRVRVTVSGERRRLADETKHHLMRIAQEATTNAVRHAKAKEISINLDYQPDSITLEVSDDGVGFDPERVLNLDFGHFGLSGIRSRAKRLHADLAIESSVGKGTRIRVQVKN